MGLYPLIYGTPGVVAVGSELALRFYSTSAGRVDQGGGRGPSIQGCRFYFPNGSGKSLILLLGTQSSRKLSESSTDWSTHFLEILVLMMAVLPEQWMALSTSQRIQALSSSGRQISQRQSRVGWETEKVRA